jgi:hypothetical protein
MKNFILTIICLVLIGNVLVKSREHTLKGVVTDKKGNPVENAVVSVDNTGLFTITNKHGFYKIKSVPESCLTLRFSHVSFEPASATIGIYNNIDLILYERGETELTEYSIEDVLDMKINAGPTLAQR